MNIKKLFILLGNGFSIDLIKKLGYEAIINLYNLFSCGNCVPWPVNNEPGFLSYKHCPNLWNLGARSHMNAADSIALIEDIITCANIASNVPITRNIYREDNIYINAYKELTSYLKHLFIYYDSKVNDNDLSKLSNWGWIKFFNKVNNDPNYEKVFIVSYNYDIWLERLLLLHKIGFNVCKFEKKYSKKFQIIKPHGSISFTYRSKLDQISFNIPYKKDLMEISDGKPRDFKVQYSNLNENYLINPIIPPAGDSGRYNLGWAKDLRMLAKTEASKLISDDEIIICGLSYWHVDRVEIDEILTSLNPLINVKLINPNPPRALNAVLSSLFKNYLCYTNSDILGE